MPPKTPKQPRFAVRPKESKEEYISRYAVFLVTTGQVEGKADAEERATKDYPEYLSACDSKRVEEAKKRAAAKLAQEEQLQAAAKDTETEKKEQETRPTPTAPVKSKKKVTNKADEPEVVEETPPSSDAPASDTEQPQVSTLGSPLVDAEETESDYDSAEAEALTRLRRRQLDRIERSRSQQVAKLRGFPKPKQAASKKQEAPKPRTRIPKRLFSDVDTDNELESDEPGTKAPRVESDGDEDLFRPRARAKRVSPEDELGNLDLNKPLLPVVWITLREKFQESLSNLLASRAVWNNGFWRRDALALGIIFDKAVEDLSSQCDRPNLKLFPFLEVLIRKVLSYYYADLAKNPAVLEILSDQSVESGLDARLNRAVVEQTRKRLLTKERLSRPIGRSKGHAHNTARRGKPSGAAASSSSSTTKVVRKYTGQR